MAPTLGRTCTPTPNYNPLRQRPEHPENQVIRGPKSGAASLGLRGEPPPLVIGQPELAPLELSLEDPVLLDEVRDDLCLMAVHDARESQQEDL